ncbi:MAG TPA: DUF4863 family protein [Deltaproteobacteria bacterium]|nr:DUF4863 family protein [Deltaproteobacteria bacterium]
MPSHDEPRAAQLLEALLPLTRRIAQLDLSDPAAAAGALSAAAPPSELSELRALMCAANAEGWLTPRRATETLSFGRLARPDEATSGLSIDVVDMAGAGAGHTHPNGEVSLCFALQGEPRFMGEPEGWVVVAPGSHHVPTVSGGRMLITYFLPGGAMEWD